MVQANALFRMPDTGSTQSGYVSVNEKIMSIAVKSTPVTLRQIVSKSPYDVDLVKASLHEAVGAGKIASFKVGPLNYYASPRTALTSEQPVKICFINECIQNALFVGKNRLNVMAHKLFDNAGG